MPTKTYSIDCTTPDQPILSGHLNLGATNRLGRSVQVTSAYLGIDGQPFFGISGEFQFSRYPNAYWEEELLKMKAGGINVVALYVFWIHHEDRQGEFDWQGDNDIRRFVQLCAKHDLWVVARVGPFCHGECRNGGLPDWLYGQPFEVRSNDPQYLACVDRYFGALGAQLQGLFFQDGGPILAVQLENEFGHTGAPWDVADRSQPAEWLNRGAGDLEHVRLLRQLAHKAGLEAPLLTFTAWGSPIIEKESLPMQGGYAYPVWVDQPGPSTMYLFRDLVNQPPADKGLAYDTHGHYPPMMAEMQGGIQVRYGNRPEVPPRSTEAFSLVTAGSGCNFLGYYIYHGGSNPQGNREFDNEFLHPQVSYDFQAPIGEYGEVRDSCRYLKCLHAFFQAFGWQLAPMGVRLPEGANSLSPSDTQSLRWAVRARNGAGFIFLNNFQDHLDLPEQADFRLRLDLPGGALQLPPTGSLTLPAGVAAILPFNLDLGGVTLASATVQPFTRIAIPEGVHYFFFAIPGCSPAYHFHTSALQGLSGDFTPLTGSTGTGLEVEPGAKRSFCFTAPDGTIVRVTTLTRDEAEHAWVGRAWAADRVVVSQADVFFTEGGLELRRVGDPKLATLVFPPLAQAVVARGARLIRTDDNCYTKFGLFAPPSTAQVQVSERLNGKFQLTFSPQAFAGVNDLFLKISYTADTGAAFINGQLIADNYNNGTPWVIGLKRFLSQAMQMGITLKFRPLRKGVVKNISSAMASRLDFEGEEVLRLDALELLPEYAARLLG